MSSLLLCRAPGKTATFIRSVRDEEGDVLKILKFEPGAPVLVEGDDLVAVMKDVGHAVFIVEADEKTPNRLKVKYDETSAFMKAELGIDVDFDDPRKKRSVAQTGETKVPGAEVQLDSDIVDILEQAANVEALGGEVSPEAVVAYVVAGNKLVDLAGIGKVKAEIIEKALGI